MIESTRQTKIAASQRRKRSVKSRKIWTVVERAKNTRFEFGAFFAFDQLNFRNGDGRGPDHVAKRTNGSVTSVSPKKIPRLVRNTLFKPNCAFILICVDFFILSQLPILN